MALFAGLMSGTSLDGIDGVIADLDAGGAAPRVVVHAHAPLEPGLRDTLLALNAPGPDEIHHAALAASAIARQYAGVVVRMLRDAGLDPGDVRALGAHGQTVRHRPGEFDGTGYTVQLLDGALLAELTGIDVVCDLRRRDIAAGGQGAPLVPAFHAERFSEPDADVAVLNLGGIANLTLLPAVGPARGFDCGPGNVLMDLWCARHFGCAFDDDGRLARGGRVLPALLASMRAEPFLHRAPPKSTGRDLFNAGWLDAHVQSVDAAAPLDVLTTLAELSACAAAEALQRHQPRTRRLVVCGGGARNAYLIGRLAELLDGSEVALSDSLGLPAEWVEATAFAWLARQFVEGRAGNLPEVTGAKGQRRLGALYPA